MAEDRPKSAPAQTAVDFAGAAARLDEEIGRALGLLARHEPGLGGRVTRHVDVGRGALGRAAAYLADRTPTGRCRIVCDARTRQAAGDELAGALEARGVEVSVDVLEPAVGRTKVVCDETAVAAVRHILDEHADAAVVAVGAGTICDIVKIATAQAGRPFVVVATAASMNGYTSAIGALLKRGVKRTVPAHMAEAVFADAGVLARAPAEMNRAGFGDLLSKPLSHMDWWLAHRVRGAAYDPTPAALLDRAFPDLLAAAPAVGAGDPRALGGLARTIVLSGFSMALAGSSAPASGGEHLVSHYWDMERFAAGDLPRALHGIQVGIATVLSARLYQELLAADVPGLAARARPPSPDVLDRLRDHHSTLPPEVVDEIRAQWAEKQRFGDAFAEEMTQVASAWSTLAVGLRRRFTEPGVLVRALSAAGCPLSPSAIGVTRDHAVHTLRVCRRIRARYVGLDLMDDLGVLAHWAPQAVDAGERA